MNPTQESIYDKTCKGQDDKCNAIQRAVDQMIADARSKMSYMLSDPRRLFDYAYNIPNPSVTGSATTYVGHIDPLRGVIGRIKEGIALGEMMGCDMSKQRRDAANLYVPNFPRR